MNRSTIDFRPSKSDRAMKPVLGALALFATVATLGLMVAAPAALAPANDAAVLAQRAAAAPVEVAIVPGSIHVVGTRARVARADEGRFVPAAYRPR